MSTLAARSDPMRRVKAPALLHGSFYTKYLLNSTRIEHINRSSYATGFL